MDKNKIITLAITIIAFIIVVSGVSYAYIKVNRTQVNNNEINTLTCLDVTLTSVNNGVSLTNAYPIPDSEGILGAPYNFTITNNCTVPVSVEINLETLSTSEISKTHVKGNIKEGENSTTKLISNGVEKNATITNATSNNLSTSYLSPSGNIGSIKNYELRIWLDENTTWEDAHSGDTPLTYQGKIVVIASPTVSNAMEDFGTNILSEAILISNTNNNVTDTPLDNPGTAISREGERVFAHTPDDYTAATGNDSYYYRGDIQNNYLVFANKCWRIVRITGNGAIKLVLQNNNGTDCSAYNMAGQSSFNNVPGVYNSASGIGFMYGDSNPSGANDNEKYLNAQANTYDSTILTFLKGWYDNVFTASDKNKLADVIWCNDKSLYSGVGYGNTYTEFAADKRIRNNGNISGATPTLICPNAGSDNKLSKFTASDTINGNGMLTTTINTGVKFYYKIGLLTADEAVFAGGAYKDEENNNYYLYDVNNRNRSFFLMSPGTFFTGDMNAYTWFVYCNGKVAIDGLKSKAILEVRPSIALNSNTTFLKGTGLINDPYIVD